MAVIKSPSNYPRKFKAAVEVVLERARLTVEFLSNLHALLDVRKGVLSSESSDVLRTSYDSIRYVKSFRMV